MSKYGPETQCDDADPITRLSKLVAFVPTGDVADFYRAAEATDVNGMPLIVVGPEPRHYPWKLLKHRSKDEVYIDQRYAGIIAKGLWPMAEDGFGGIFVACCREDGCEIGYIDPAKPEEVAFGGDWLSFAEFRLAMLPDRKPAN
jgi:hypothetical protein